MLTPFQAIRRNTAEILDAGLPTPIIRHLAHREMWSWQMGEICYIRQGRVYLFALFDRSARSDCQLPSPESKTGRDPRFLLGFAQIV